MIYVTGDTHGGEDMSKLNTRLFPEQKQMTKDDYVIVAGDFGFPWGGRYGRQDRYFLKWLNDKPFTTLFADGNHENFDLLATFEEEDFMGGRVQRISDSVLHLKRGEIYTLQGKAFFVFGGARSHDMHLRTEFVDWWKQEEPSEEEYAGGMDALERRGWKVDFVITHAAPASVAPKRAEEPVCMYLDKIRKKLEFEKWFFGHYHEDREYEKGRFRALYQDVVRVS